MSARGSARIESVERLPSIGVRRCAVLGVDAHLSLAVPRQTCHADGVRLRKMAPRSVVVVLISA